MATIIQQRRDTSVNWAATDPIMAQGEIGVDLTLNKYKIGDGVTAWSGLAFPTGGGSAIAVLDEGVSVTAAAVSFDYVGDNVVVTDAGSGVLTVTHTTPAQIATNAASIVTLDADAITQNAVIALNTAKVTYDDAAIVAANAASIVTLDSDAITQDAAIALNTAKVGITAGQAADIVTNTAKVTYDDAALVAANAASIVTLDADAITQDAAIALNTAKTGITVGQAADIVTNNAKISYTDAAAVTANTAKVGITVGQAADIVSNNAKISYTDAAAVALNTAKVSYDDAAAVALNTAKVSVPSGGTTGQVLSKVSATDYDLQWSTGGGGGGGDAYLANTQTFTGTNSFTGVKNVAISGNGSGTALPTAAILNDTTQSITGAGSIYGQELPSLVEDTGTYNITTPNLFGIGGLFIAKPTINLTGAGPYSAAGPYQSLGAFATVNKTHAATQTFISYPVWTQTTINNTGGGTMNATEAGSYVGLTLGTNVTASQVSALTSTEPAVGAGSSIAQNMGVRVVDKAVGTYNAGYQYGTSVATVGTYAFDSGTSTHPSRFGGTVEMTQGVIKNYREDTSGTVVMNSTDYHVFSSSTGAIYLPAIADCEVGQIFVITNFSGGTKTVNLNGASASYGKSLTITTGDSRHVVKRGSATWTVY